MNRFVRLAATALISTLLLHAGCARQKKHQLALEGAPADFSGISMYHVNVTNASGTVEILTRRNLKSPWIEVKRSRPRVGGDMAGPGQTPKQFSNATFSDDKGIGTVTVVSSAGDVASAGEWVRIIVYVPALGDVKVRNAGGHVNVVNAHGEVDIQNSTTNLGFGHITCASIHPTKSTLLLSTDDGTIDVSIPASSQFKLDATTGAGEVMISARNSIVTEAVERPMNWTGVVNGGTAAATLRTSKGNIKIRIGATE